MAWLLLICGAYGGISLYLGQDNHFDNFLYHRYVPWAWLNGRMDFDFTPADVQSYFNPLTELPVYVLREKLSAKESGAALGAIQGLGAWLVMMISWAVLHRLPHRERVWAVAAVTLFGALGVEALDGVGRGTNDLLLSPFPLLALLLLVSRPRAPGTLTWAAAGFVLGLGCGLKITLGPHAIAFGVLAGLAPGSWWHRGRRMAVAAASGIAGMAATGGWWMAEMYQRFGNPIFPQWNHLFRSPYFSTEKIETPGLAVDHGLLEYLILPFRFAADPWLVRSVGSDYRFAACTLVLVAVGLFWLTAKVLRRPYPLPWTSAAPLVFFAVSFWVWEGMFGACLRYVVSLDLLAGLILLIATYYVAGSLRNAGMVIYLVLACLLIGQDVDIHKRRVPWQPRKFYDVKVPKNLDPDALVLLADNAWAAYMIPNFPSDLRFLRLLGMFNFKTVGTPMEALLLDTLDRHQGKLYAIVRANRLNRTEPKLRFFKGHFEIVDGTCVSLNRRINGIFYFCEARQVGLGPAPSTSKVSAGKPGKAKNRPIMSTDRPSQTSRH